LLPTRRAFGTTPADPIFPPIASLRFEGWSILKRSI